MRRLSSRWTGPFRISRLLRCAVWAPGGAGPQSSLSAGPAGAVRGAAQRRESVGDGSGVSPGDAAVSRESPWDDDVVDASKSTWDLGWGTRRRCGCWTAAISPSRAVARQYCGSLGKWPTWNVPGLRQPAGTPWWTNGFICRRAGPRTPTAVRRRGCRRRVGTTGRKPVGVGDAGAGPGAGASESPGLPGTTPSGCRRPSGRDWRLWGCATCWTFPAAPRSDRWSQPQSGVSIGRPRKPRLKGGQRRTMVERSDELPEEAWREITVAREARVPAATSSAPTGCGRPVSGSLAKSTGPSTAGIWTAASPANLSNAPEDTSLETLAYVGGSRWRIEPSSRLKKAMWGLSTRPAPGRAGIITWPCACWAERFS